MPGGLLQIASSGIQDRYLTLNPEITFFKKVFKRHTKFSTEMIEVSIEGVPRYGSDFFINLPKQGDLIHRGFFEIEIPKLNIYDSYITNSIYTNFKSNKLKNIENEMNLWLKEYNELKTFSDIQITFYQKILILLQSSDITYQNILTQATLDLKIYSNVLDKTIFKIDEDIKDKIDIISYIINFNLTFDSKDDLNNGLITFSTFLNNIKKIYSNNLSQLTYYHSNYIYYKNKYNTVNTGNIEYSWIKNLGHHFFTNFEAEIGGQVIENYSSDHFNITQFGKIKEQQLENYNKIIGNVDELNNISSIKKSTKIYIPLNFWFNRLSSDSLPLISLRYNEIKLNFTINNLNNLIYFYDFKDEYDNILIIEYHYKDHEKNMNSNNKSVYTPKKLSKVINSIEELNFSKIDYLNRERIYKYYCKTISRGLLEIKYPNISSSDLDYLFTNYGTIDTTNGNTINFNQYMKLRQSFATDSNLNNISLYLLEYKDPRFANYNTLINKVSTPKIKFFCEYVFLDEMERNKFASGTLEYVVNIPRQINTDVLNDEFFSNEIDLLNPTKDFIWFFRPKTQVFGIDKFSNKDPSVYNKSEYIDEKLVSDLKILFQDFEVVNFATFKEELYTTVFKYKYLNPNLIDGYYYYSFSLFPKDSQPSGNINLSNIKGKIINAKLNSSFLNKYFNSEINKNNLDIEFVIINNYYNLIKVDKGKLTSVYY